MQDSGKRDLLRLLLTPGLGHARVGRLCEHFGASDAALGASAEAWTSIRGIGAGLANKAKAWLTDPASTAAAEQELERIDRAGVRLIALNEPAYPKLLALIPDPPRLLWVRGDLQESNGLALAIVGSRRCTHYGREQAERFGHQAAEAALTVVSGGAYGIDIHAHRGALKAPGRTIVVLGSGLLRPYPESHAEVYDQIADGRGAVISELPMDTPPRAEHFLPRNRIISGLSLGVLLIEAAMRSGALNTARQCVEDHSRELMVLPGRVDSTQSAGCHHVLRQGWGQLVTCIGDVIQQLEEAGTTLAAAGEQAPSIQEPVNGQGVFSEGLSDSQAVLVNLLNEPRTLDELTQASGLEAGPVQADLTLLEIRGVIERRGGVFVRRT